MFYSKFGGTSQYGWVYFEVKSEGVTVIWRELSCWMLAVCPHEIWMPIVKNHLSFARRRRWHLFPCFSWCTFTCV